MTVQNNEKRNSVHIPPSCRCRKRRTNEVKENVMSKTLLYAPIFDKKAAFRPHWVFSFP